MLLSVDNDGRDLLIHKEEDGGKQGRNTGCQGRPPRVGAKWINKPAAAFPSGLQRFWYRQLGRFHLHQPVNGGHRQDGNDDGKVRNDVAHTVAEKALELELFQMPGNEEGADEEQQAHQEGVGQWVATHGLVPVHHGSAVAVVKGAEMVAFGVGLVQVGEIVRKTQFVLVDQNRVRDPTRPRRILAVAKAGMYRSLVGNMQDLFDGLLDEDEGDKAGKILLREPGDVADKGRGVRRHQYDEEKAGPKARPEPKGQIFPAHGFLAKAVHNGFKDQNRPRRA